MSLFHVCNKLKSIFLVALSVAILTCSIPFTSFRSQALEAGVGYLGSLAYSEYLSLVSYLLTRGYSAPKINVPGTEDEMTVSSVRYTGQAEEILNSFLSGIKTLNFTMYQGIYRALERSAKSGKLVLTTEQDEFLRGYFESLTVDSSLVLGHSTKTFEPLSAGSTFYLSYDYFEPGSSSYIRTCNIEVTTDIECLPVMTYEFNGSMLQFFYITFIPLTKITDNSVIRDAIHVTEVENGPVDISPSNSYLGDTNNGLSRTLAFNFGDYTNAGYGFSNMIFPAFATLVGWSTVALNTILQYFRDHGNYASSVDYTSSQTYDVSNTDVLSTASEIDSNTGEVSPGLTMYLPEIESLVDILQDFSDRAISWASAIKALGLSSVASDASVQTKEDAQDRVAVPDPTYQWISETTWGANTISETVTNELVDAQTQEGTIAEDIADQYSENAPDSEDPDEQKNKGGLAMLLATALLYLSLWDDPNTDPTSPDSGGIAGDPEDTNTVPWLQDTLRAIPVVAGLESSIFQSAGGSNGYGFIYTVGVSFVLFSVIIGAGHFFGSLGNHADIQAKQVDSPNRPGRSGKQLARSGSHRHARVDSIKYKYEHSGDSFSVGS